VIFGDQGVLWKTIHRLGTDAAVEIFKEAPKRDIPPKDLSSSFKPPDNTLSPIRKTRQGCGQAMVRYIEEAARWSEMGGWMP